MPTPGGTTRKLRNAFWPQRRNSYRSRFRWNSIAMFSASASGEPKRSTCTEWSITRSTGTRGLIRFGSPPSRCMALRMAARSTTAGTPVKSCSTHPGRLERHLDRRLPHRLPAGQVAHVVLGHLVAVAVPQHGFQQHADRIRQRGDAASSRRLPASSRR